MADGADEFNEPPIGDPQSISERLIEDKKRFLVTL